MISELTYLQENVALFGDTPVSFVMNGDEDCKVQFESYQNGLVIYLDEE